MAAGCGALKRWCLLFLSISVVCGVHAASPSGEEARGRGNRPLPPHHHAAERWRAGVKGQPSSRSRQDPHSAQILILGRGCCRLPLPSLRLSRLEAVGAKAASRLVSLVPLLQSSPQGPSLPLPPVPLSPCVGETDFYVVCCGLSKEKTAFCFKWGQERPRPLTRALATRAPTF